MRDILPNSGLNLIEREEIAAIIHKIVRWKRWYEFLMDYYGIEKIAENYVKIAEGKIKVDEKGAEKTIPDEKYIAIRYSFSDFLASFLKDKPDFIEHLNKEARTTLCINLNKISRERAIEWLEKEGIKAWEGNMETAIYAESRARYSALIKKGYAHVQDESSQLISKIVAKRGTRILDYCAGNGGKSLAMASITKNNASIYANDVDKRRLDNLKKRAEQYEASIKIMENDGKFDAVLVDAPCTGVGAARRNPEAKYVSGYGDFPQKQADIIKKAWEFVDDGGYLIYSICSFLPDETEAIDKIDGMPVMLDSKWLREYGNGYITWMPEGDILFIAIKKK